jgi:hypothetical protein
MCELSVEELQSYLRTKVNVRNVCLQLPNIGNITLFASCFQMTLAKSGHQLNCSYQQLLALIRELCQACL